LLLLLLLLFYGILDGVVAAPDFFLLLYCYCFTHGT
jgi:hypothetical protein